jgi:hypothetical protein
MWQKWAAGIGGLLAIIFAFWDVGTATNWLVALGGVLALLSLVN